MAKILKKRWEIPGTTRNHLYVLRLNGSQGDHKQALHFYMIETIVCSMYYVVNTYIKAFITRGSSFKIITNYFLHTVSA